MAFDKISGLKGSSKQYRLNPDVKKYTLRDYGFQETKSGNFQYVRSLSTSTNPKQGVMLKVVVAKDLDSFRISTTTANGLKNIDIYNLKSMEQAIENLEYMLSDFVERNVLEEVK